jgi:hypothetical protein
MQPRVTFQVELDIAEKAEKAGAEFYHEHKQFIIGLTWEHLEERSIIMKSNLIALAELVRLMFIHLSIQSSVFFQSRFCLLSTKSRLLKATPA